MRHEADKNSENSCQLIPTHYMLPLPLYVKCIYVKLLCYVMLCYVMLCYVMLCYVKLIC